MSLKANILKNGFANALQKLVRIGEQLLVVPFFISAWGTATYGEWLTMTAIPSALALADLGLGTAAANTFVLRYSSGDKEGAARAAKAGFWLLTIACIIAGLIGGVVLLGLSHFGSFDNGSIPTDAALIAVSLLLISRALSFFTQLIDAFGRSARQAARSIHAISIYSFIKVLACMGSLKAGGGVIFLAASDLLSTIIFIPVYAFWALRLLPDVPWHNKINIRHEVSGLLKKGVAYLAAPVWQAIFFQGTTLVVRKVLGPEAVALFNTTRTLCRSVNQLYNTINSSIFPELQVEIGLGHWQSARKLFRLGLLMAIVGALSGVTFLWFAGQWIYKIWTHGAMHPPDSVWCIFLIGILLNSLWWTAAMVFRAANRPEGFAIVGIIGAILSVISSWFLSKHFGLLGAAAGSLVIEMIMCVYVINATCKILKQSRSNLFVDIGRDVVSRFRLK